jgi:lipopolysaccharide export system protein LptA
MTKLLLGVTVVIVFAALASAQVGAPNPQGSNTLAQRIEQAANGATLLRGNVQMSITGTVELRADEVDVSPDGREMVLRNNVTVRIPSNLVQRTPGVNRQ